MITEVWAADGLKGTQNIVSINPEAKVVPIQTLHVPNDPCDAADFYREHADVINDVRDHKLSTNTVADEILTRCGRGELDDCYEIHSNEN